MNETIHLDIQILWKDIQDQGLSLDLNRDDQTYEASLFESRFVFLLEKFLDSGAINFKDKEELVEIMEWWQEHLSVWTGANTQYCSQLWVLMEKMKTRLR